MGFIQPVEGLTSTDWSPWRKKEEVLPPNCFQTPDCKLWKFQPAGLLCKFQGLNFSDCQSLAITWANSLKEISLPSFSLCMHCTLYTQRETKWIRLQTHTHPVGSISLENIPTLTINNEGGLFMATENKLDQWFWIRGPREVSQRPAKGTSKVLRGNILFLPFWASTRMVPLLSSMLEDGVNVLRKYSTAKYRAWKLHGYS